MSEQQKETFESIWHRMNRGSCCVDGFCSDCSLLFEGLKQLHEQEIKEKESLIYIAQIMLNENDIEIKEAEEKAINSIKFQKCNTHNKLESVFQIIEEKDKEIEFWKNRNDENVIIMKSQCDKIEELSRSNVVRMMKEKDKEIIKLKDEIKKLNDLLDYEMI